MAETKCQLDRLVFVQYPGDWIGKWVEVWPGDLGVTLDSGLTSKERKDRGLQPTRTMLIESETTSGDIVRFLKGVD